MLGSYDVTFEVSASDGRKVTARRHVTADQFGFVSFPDDFDFAKQLSLRSAGSFSWRAIVEGKTIAHGSFRWASAGREARVFD